MLLLVALLIEVVIYDGLLERYDRFRHLDLTQCHLILQVGDAPIVLINSQPLQMNLTARPQHQVPVYVEHFNGGIGLVEFFQTLYQFGVVIHVDW